MAPRGSAFQSIFASRPAVAWLNVILTDEKNA